MKIRSNRMKIKSISISVLCILLNSSILFAMSPIESIFPVGKGSYWVYTDQDGNELTRRVSNEKEIDGKKYKSFEYQPKLSNKIDFQPLIHVNLFNIDHIKVAFNFSNEYETTLKNRLKKELEIYSHLLKDSLAEIYPAESGITVDLKYDIDVNSDKEHKILDIRSPVRKDWNVSTTEVKIKIQQEIKGLPDFGHEIEDPETTLTFKIIQSAKKLNPENVTTKAGVFAQCNKIEYKTITEVKSDNILTPELKAGETVTTVWFADQIGMVKLRQESHKIFLYMLAESEMLKKTKTDIKVNEIISPKIITLELKKFKIESMHREDE
ncbi:hypothetical protein JT359_06110 [Candidatus Poribacteria bacterium]|nr:hypothetical protein [Candidatus Poribacteria bacterium]